MSRSKRAQAAQLLAQQKAADEELTVFLIRSLDRNDQELAALQDIHNRLHAMKLEFEARKPALLLELGRGKIRLTTATVTADEGDGDTTSAAAASPREQTGSKPRDDGNVIVVDRLIGTTEASIRVVEELQQQAQKEEDEQISLHDLAVSFLLHFKLRRRLLNRLARRLLRVAHALDTNKMPDTPQLPSYGDLRLHVDEEAVQALEQVRHEKERILQQQHKFSELLSTAGGAETSVASDTAPSRDDSGLKPMETESAELEDKDDETKPVGESGTKEADRASPQTIASFLPHVEYQSFIEYKEPYEKRIVMDVPDKEGGKPAATVSTTKESYSLLERRPEEKPKEDYQLIPLGSSGIGASSTSRLMTSMTERQAEYQRWKTAFLQKVPHQPSFPSEVYFYKERLAKAKEMQVEIDEKAKQLAAAKARVVPASPNKGGKTLKRLAESRASDGDDADKKQNDSAMLPTTKSRFGGKQLAALKRDREAEHQPKGEMDGTVPSTDTAAKPSEDAEEGTSKLEEEKSSGDATGGSPEKDPSEAEPMEVDQDEAKETAAATDETKQPLDNGLDGPASKEQKKGPEATDSSGEQKAEDGPSKDSASPTADEKVAEEKQDSGSDDDEEMKEERQSVDMDDSMDDSEEAKEHQNEPEETKEDRNTVVDDDSDEFEDEGVETQGASDKESGKIDKSFSEDKGESSATAGADTMDVDEMDKETPAETSEGKDDDGITADASDNAEDKDVGTEEKKAKADDPSTADAPSNAEDKDVGTEEKEKKEDDPSTADAPCNAEDEDVGAEEKEKKEEDANDTDNKSGAEDQKEKKEADADETEDKSDPEDKEDDEANESREKSESGDGNGKKDSDVEVEEPEEDVGFKRPISLVPTPSFYNQDMKRIRLIHAELMSSSIRDTSRAQVEACTRDYNKALRQSNELFERRQQLQSQYNHMVLENRAFISQLSSDYQVKYAVAKKTWDVRRVETDKQKLDTLLPHRNNINHMPQGTPMSHLYMRQPDPARQVVAQYVGSMVDAIEQVAQGVVAYNSYREPFRPPPQPDGHVAHKRRMEEQIQQELNKVQQQLGNSEDERQRAWKRMIKAKGELDLNNYNVPVPPLRQSSTQNVPQQIYRPSSSNYASYVPQARPQQAVAQSQSKYSAAKVRARVASDGSVAPVTAPKRDKNGLFIRPAGRTRKNMNWDAVRGIWVPIDE